MKFYDNSLMHRVVTALRAARRVLFITGAGISADSGLPTYRGIGGLYNDRLTADDMPIELALSGAMMQREPHIAWKYISQIERACRGARFNAAHRIIAECEPYFDAVWVLTQNVEGFHRDAGSRNLIEIHGNIHRLYCSVCDYRIALPDYASLTIPPLCPTCAAILRPAVVLFGEFLPEQALATMREAFSEGFDMVFSIGTSSTFSYIAEPVLQARRIGIPTVEINPDDTVVSEIVDYKLTSGAAASLLEIWRRFHTELTHS